MFWVVDIKPYTKLVTTMPTTALMGVKPRYMVYSNAQFFTLVIQLFIFAKKIDTFLAHLLLPNFNSFFLKDTIYSLTTRTTDGIIIFLVTLSHLKKFTGEVEIGTICDGHINRNSAIF